MDVNATFILLAPWIQILIPQPCFDTVFVDLDFLNVACLKVIISKCLGYGIILGSILVKLPQIMKILSAKSGEGISMPSLILELVAIISTAAYGHAQKFPFSAYGDSFSLLIQTFVIGFLVLLFVDQLTLALLFATTVSVVVGYCMSPYVPLSALVFLQGMNMPVIVVSKLIQAFANYSKGSTGQLSMVTYMMLFLGALARIFTSIQETGDNLVVMTYVVASTCNGIIVAQIFYYWNATTKPKRE